MVILLGFVFTPGMASAKSPLEAFNGYFEQLVKETWHKTVTIHGIQTTVFDYALMAQQAKQSNSAFSRSLAALRKVEPKTISRGDIDKVFWINAYNFAAMKLVVDHYPIDSIRNLKVSLIKYPWSIKAISIGGKKYSLKTIEHDILLKRYADPKIVFAVSCAAISCPDRFNEIFKAKKFDEQMEKILRTFLKNQQKGLHVDKKDKVLTLSWIFKKDEGHFKGNGQTGVLDFVLKYLSEELKGWILKNRSELKIKYFDHDWGLNDLALKDK